MPKAAFSTAAPAASLPMVFPASGLDQRERQQSAENRGCCKLEPLIRKMRLQWRSVGMTSSLRRKRPNRQCINPAYAQLGPPRLFARADGDRTKEFVLLRCMSELLTLSGRTQACSRMSALRGNGLR